MKAEELKEVDLEELKKVDRPRTYLFSGHAYPERYQLGMDPPHEAITLHDDGTSSWLKISIEASQVIVTVHTNSGKNLLDMKNGVTSSVRVLADSLGFVSGAAFDIEIISCVDPEGQHHVFNTAVDGIIDCEPGSPESIKIFSALIFSANISSFVRMALADLRHAIREPSDTCTNCYRAVESIRHEYLEGPDTGATRRSSWERLRSAVGVQREDLDWLEERATPRRHGRPINITANERNKAIRIARKVIQAHCLTQLESTGPGMPIISESADPPPMGC